MNENNDNFINTLLFVKKYQLAYLTGVLLGDGCIYINTNNKEHNIYQFSVTSSDLDMVEICQKIVLNIFNKESKIKTIFKKDSKDVSYYQLLVCSKKICLILKRLTENRNKIPYIKNSDIYSNKFLCVGLMDSDGYISKVKAGDGYYRYRVGYHATSSFIPILMDKLNSFGVITGKISLRKGFSGKEGKRKNEKDSYCVTINTRSYRDNLFFLIDRKQKLLDEFVKNKKKNKHTGDLDGKKDF